MNNDSLKRFEEKYTQDANGCWKWTAATRNGYGVFKIYGRMRYAHRLSYQHFVGSIRLGLEIDHLCRQRACVNPSHLEPVIHTINVRRGESGIRNRSKTHCKHGHEFTAENTNLRTRRGWKERICIACARLHEAARRRNTL